MAYNHEWPYVDPNRTNTDWEINQIKQFKIFLEDFIKNFGGAYEELTKILEDLARDVFPPCIESAFEKWMQEHANELVGGMVKNVFFEITDDGYFVANIPESWEEIEFNTSGLDIEVALQPEYGHLVLSY